MGLKLAKKKKKKKDDVDIQGLWCLRALLALPT